MLEVGITNETLTSCLVTYLQGAGVWVQESWKILNASFCSISDSVEGSGGDSLRFRGLGLWGAVFRVFSRLPVCQPASSSP